MNPVAVAHLLAAIVIVAVSVPLIRKKVKMNRWYGVRIPAAFESEEAWFDINHYGGRLLLFWGASLGVTAAVGSSLEKQDWFAYNWTSLVVVMGGLLVVVAKIQQYARKRKTA